MLSDTVIRHVMRMRAKSNFLHHMIMVNKTQLVTQLTSNMSRSGDITTNSNCMGNLVNRLAGISRSRAFSEREDKCCANYYNY